MSEENEKPAISEEIAAAAALEDINIEESMSRDYIDYSMSVIVGRALPDARDGMKPVHRRCLFAMHELGTTERDHALHVVRPPVLAEHAALKILRQLSRLVGFIVAPPVAAVNIGKNRFHLA